MDIFSYTDFTIWINDALNALKKQKSFATLRYVASRSQIDPGSLVRMKQGKSLPGKKVVARLGGFFELDENGQAYLEQMIALAKSKSDKEAWTHYQKLNKLRGTEVKTLEYNEFEYFQEWHHSVIRSLLSIVNIKKNYAALGKLLIPRIPAKTAKDSIDLLHKLGMIKRNEKGFWKPVGKFVGSGSRWKNRSIQLYQKQALSMASQAIDKIEPGERDISTVTLNIPKKELPVFNEYIKEFRKGMMGMAQGFKNDDTVYQLNISFFPGTERASLKNSGDVS